MANLLDWGRNVSDDVMYPRMTYMAPAPDNLKAQSHTSAQHWANSSGLLGSIKCD